MDAATSDQVRPPADQVGTPAGPPADQVGTPAGPPADQVGTPSSLEAARALVRASRVLERASDALTLSQYRVLSAVASGEQRGSRVAQRLALGRPTVSAAVAALCRGGLLVADVEERDKRALSLRLTPAGSALLQAVEEEMVRRLDDLCARTPDAAQVARSLAWLGGAVDQRLDERLAGGGAGRPGAAG